MPRKFFPILIGLLILSIAFTPITASAALVSPAEANRAIVVQRLEKLGATPKQAQAQVAMLNQHDLATLAAHPQMIHRAGGSDSGRALFWGIVIVLVVVGITAALSNL